MTRLIKPRQALPLVEVWVIALVGLFACIFLPLSYGLAQAKENKDKGTKADLGPEEKKVVELLFEDWGKKFRSTNIEQAMERTKLPYSHTTRLRIASYLVVDAQAKKKMRWQPATYVLTNNEKRIARMILRAGTKSGQAPVTADMARALGISKTEAEEGLAALTWLGFLEPKNKESYALAANHKRFLNGLGFNFHEVALENGERFNIH